MFRLIGKDLIRFRTRAASTCCNQIYFLQTQSLKSYSSSSVDIAISKNEQLPTVSYLINSCGFSLESAISASKKFSISSTEKADSVVEVFRKHGFTESQIQSFIKKRPIILLKISNETLPPKIEFFKSLGFSSTELAKFISREPLILFRGLETQISACNFLRAFVHTDKNLVKVLMKSFSLISFNLEKLMRPNIATLRKYGVADSRIGVLLMIQPSILAGNNEQFEEKTLFLKNMGFDPKTQTFLLAIRTMVTQPETSLKRKMEVLRSYGVSEDELLSAFKVQPMCLLTSLQKLKKIMDFFVNDLSWKPSMVTRHPILFLLSLENRMIPRCSVLQVLTSKGLVKKDVSMIQVFKMTQKRFIKRFVDKYEKEVPEVVKAHQGMIEFKGFTYSSPTK